MKLDPKWRLALLGLCVALWPLAPSWEPTALDPCDHLATAVAFLLTLPWACGRLFAAVGLPRVSAYILAGIAAGPFVLGLLQPEAVSALRALDDLALFLIAFSAGGELRSEGVGRSGRTLASLSWKLGIAGALSAAVVAFLCRDAIPFLSALAAPHALLAGAMLALVVASLSPAVTMAVLVETGARGPLSEIFLGVSILLDLCLLLALSLLVTLGTVPGAAGEAPALAVIIEMAGSAAAGVLLGAALIAWQRRVGAAPAIFLTLATCGYLVVCDALGLQVMLGALVAGSMAANLEPRCAALLGVSRAASRPVFLLFFSLAGAALDLRALRLMIGPAFALAAARLGAQWLAVRWVSARTGQRDLLRGPAFLGFLPQSVISLGLVVLVERQFPAWGSEFAALATAVIAVNMLAGPPALKHALEAAGETTAPVPARQPALAPVVAG